MAGHKIQKIKKMKRILLIGCFALFMVRGFSQEILTFKMANPAIEYFAPDNYLSFDILVKASASGTYLYGTQIVCNITIGNVNTGIPAIMALSAPFNGSYDPPGPVGLNQMYNNPFTTWNGNNLNIAINHTNVLDPYGPAAYCAMLTTYQTLGRISIALLPGAVSSTAGITFKASGMDGQQFKWQNTFPYNTLYGTPNVYAGNNFSSLYYGRVFSGGAFDNWALGPWTEFGGTLLWSNSKNTSVWDTTSAAATISAAGSQVNGLRIHPGARLKILPGGQLTAAGATDINEAKGLWISSDATGTGSFIDNGTISYTSGSALAQRYLDPNKWHGYCIPLTQTLTKPYKDYYMKYYDNTLHHYRYVINTALDSTLNSVGLGYMMWSGPVTGTTPTSPTGQLNTASAPISIAVTRPAYPGAPGQKFDNWNLIGNPFPSAVDLSSASITWNNVIQQAYFWNPGSGNYSAYIKAGGGTHTQFAPAQQGFFVRHDTVTTTATSFVYTNNTVRTQNTESFLKEDLSDMILFDVTNAVNGYSDLGVVRFAEGTTSGFDENLDALKLTGDADAPQLYFPVAGDNYLHVNVLPWTGINQVVPMSFTFSQAASVTITASHLESFRSGTSIFLEDTKESNMHELTTDPAYTFTSSPSDSPNRFVLHFYNPFFGVEDKSLSGVQIYSFDQYVYVRNLEKGTTKGEIQIFDLLGRKVFGGNLKDTELNKFLPGVNSGYYLVRVVTPDNAYSQKVYLK